jgi:hypothetical protein
MPRKAPYARIAITLDLEHAVRLVPSLIVLERVRPAVAPPFGAIDLVRPGEEGIVDDDLPASLDVEQHGLVERAEIPRLLVEDRPRVGVDNALTAASR